MRHSLLLLPLAVVALSGCVAGGSPSPQQSVNATSGYMTAEHSASLIVVPGDTTTIAQLRYSPPRPMSEVDNRQSDNGLLKAAGL